MAYEHIWGFGGVMLTSGGYTATFTHALGSMAFEQINRVYTTLKQEQHIIFLGYRVKIGFDAWNTGDTDYTEMLNLIDVLNSGTYGGQDIIVYPNYSTTDLNLYYNMRLTSGVDFQSIAAVKAGQKITLSFESYEPVYTLPSLASDQTTGELIQLGGGANNILLLGGTDKLLYNTGA